MRKGNKRQRSEVEIAASLPRRHRDRALVIMAREPKAGEVKTRLCPPLTEEEAAGFYECLLGDLLEGLSLHCPWDAWIAYTHGSDAYFRPYDVRGFSLMCQRGITLGERMHEIFVDLLSSAYRSVIVVGSDVPGMEATEVERAFRLLEAGGKHVVLGPAEDGGYYLVGLKHPKRELFQRIAWSTDRVLEQTLERAKKMHAHLETVRSNYDVDVATDLERLWGDLQKSSALRHRLPKTYHWLCEHYGPS